MHIQLYNITLQGACGITDMFHQKNKKLKQHTNPHPTPQHVPKKKKKKQKSNKQNPRYWERETLERESRVVDERDRDRDRDRDNKSDITH